MIAARTNGSFYQRKESMRMRIGIWGGLIALVGAVLASSPVAAQTWTQHNKGVWSPPARYSPAMAYDSVRQRVVLFGGRGSSWLFGDTWEWDGSSWTLRTPTTSPRARLGCAMAYDSERRRQVLLGGTCACNKDT